MVILPCTEAPVHIQLATTVRFRKSYAEAKKILARDGNGSQCKMLTMQSKWMVLKYDMFPSIFDT